MNLPHAIRFEDEALRPDAPAAEPKVFVRSISAPPGAPWDQARSANLEARHGSPLPIDQVIYRLRRLTPWRPGASARFAAIYVLARDIGASLDTTVEVEGRRFRELFLSPENEAAQRRRMILPVGIVALGCALSLAAVGSALAVRVDAQARLGILETGAAAKLRSAQSVRKLEDQARELDRMPGRPASLDRVIQDLGWVARAKSSAAEIEGVHWSKGLLAVEVRGEEPPFVSTDGRRVERAPKPVRPGVWLWGITSHSPADVQTEATEPGSVSRGGLP